MDIRRFSIAICIVVILLLIGFSAFVVFHANSSVPESASSGKEKNMGTSGWFTPQTIPIYMLIIAMAIFLFRYPSKDDVKSLKEDLQGNIKASKEDLQGNIKSLKEDLEGNIKNNREELQQAHQNHIDHLSFHLYSKNDSPNLQKGELLDDEHRERTRPSSTKSD